MRTIERPTIRRSAPGDAERPALPAQLVAGAAAGLAATVPMTVAMAIMHRILGRDERHPLPPQHITEHVLDRAHADVGRPARGRLALAAHFAFGAAAGALYGPIAARSGAPVVTGVMHGLGVWAGAYLGWLPALRLLPPATRESRGRNAPMIAAHVVWGAALGLMLSLLRRSGQRPVGTN